MSKTREIIGKRLREFRKSKKYSLEELAHKCGLNPAHLGKIERGERNFTIETLDKIVTALDLSYMELFDFDTRVKPSLNPIIEKTVSYLEVMTVEEQKHIYQTAYLLAGRDFRRKLHDNRDNHENVDDQQEDHENNDEQKEDHGEHNDNE